jgi:hypothetical protein
MVRPVVLAVVFFLLGARTAGAQLSGVPPRDGPKEDRRTFTPITRDQPGTVTVTIPTADRPAGRVAFRIDPDSHVELFGARTRTLTWDPASKRDFRVTLRMVVSREVAAGPFLAARLALRWSNGQRDSLEVWVDVRAEARAVAGSNNDFEVELTPVQRSAPPGGAVRLHFSIVNLQETDVRLRLRVVGGPGWKLVDPEVERREWFIQRLNWIQDEIDLALPNDAPVGERQLVRLLVEEVGGLSEIEARNYVSVSKRGGAKPGVPIVAGSSTFGLSQLGAGGLDAAQRSRALTFSSKFGPKSNFSFSYDRGLEENLSNYRYEEAQTRITGNVRHAGWDASFGNYVAAQGNALTGPFVLGRGVSVKRPAGRLLTELVVSQPNTISGLAGGHLVRGRAGMRTPKLTVAIAASDFGRRAGGYTTTSSVQTTVLDSATQEELDFERRVTTSSASNRAQGLGLDTEFRPASAHRMSFRTGGLWLSNAAGDHMSAPVGEASYGLSTKWATLNTRWRDMPPTVTGISIQGDDLGLDGSLRVSRDLGVVVRGYRSSTDTVRRNLSSQSEGASLGVRFMRGTRRVEVRRNYGESRYSWTTIRRTVSVLGATPVGPFTVNGSADVGEQDTGLRVEHLALYRGDVTWVGSAGTASFSASHSQQGGVVQQRFDLLASLQFRGTEVAGGAWVTRGYASGGRPGAWTSVGVPVGFESMLLLGLDYSPLTWTDLPSLRGMVGVRKRFTFPVPFVRPAPPGIPHGIGPNDE